MRNLAVILVIAVLGGCGGGGGSADFTLVGNWRNTQAGQDGVGVTNCPGSVGDASCGANDRITFFDDGRFTATDGTDVLTGNWSLQGNNLTSTFTEVNGAPIQPITSNTRIDPDNDSFEARPDDEPGVFYIISRV